MKKKIIVFLSAVIFIALPEHSFAWGKKGHQIVADIAFHYLDSATKLKVQKYLRQFSFEDAATWMDDMRSNSYYDYMKSWHYIDIEEGKEYVPLPEKNIVTVLHAAIMELLDNKSLSNKKIKTDLLLIFHLMGDLHQPLHTGYPIDKGGNLVNVSFLYKSYHTNLHAVWDDEIIDAKNITADSCLTYYDSLSTSEIALTKKINITQWMNESRSYLPEVYDFKNGFIDENYVDSNAIVIKKQLLKAGLRLAFVLQQIFRS
jgi:hypothetical protein